MMRFKELHRSIVENMSDDEIRAHCRHTRDMYHEPSLRAAERCGRDVSALFRVNAEFDALKRAYAEERRTQFPYYKFRAPAYAWFEVVAIADLRDATERGRAFCEKAFVKKEALVVRDFLSVCACNKDLFLSFLDKNKLHEENDTAVLAVFFALFTNDLVAADPAYFTGGGDRKKCLQRAVKKLCVPLARAASDLSDADAEGFVCGAKFSGTLYHDRVLLLQHLGHRSAARLQGMYTTWRARARATEELFVFCEPALRAAGAGEGDGGGDGSFTRGNFFRAVYGFLDALPRPECHTDDAKKAVLSSAYSGAELAAAVEAAPNKKLLFRIVGLILDAAPGRGPLRAAFLAHVRPATRGTTTRAAFGEGDAWKRKLLDDITARFAPTVEHNSTYADKRKDSIARSFIDCLFFLEKYAARAHSPSTGDHFSPAEDEETKEDGGALRLWMSGCTASAARAAIVEYGKSKKSAPDRVKSTRPVHQALLPVATMLRLFRQGMHEYIPEPTVRALCTDRQAWFVAQIEDETVPFDSRVRRVVSDDEYARMIAFKHNDATALLLLTLLYEVGLRAGAITNLRASVLIDFSEANGARCYSPRKRCAAPEKKKQTRVFLASANLQRRVAAFVAEKRSVITPDSFVFSTSADLSTPLNASTLGRRVKTMARDAGVTTNVHPHVFRHTIVGNLMKNNSAEVVSKYIGHRDVTTTLSHYWLVDIEELSENLISPFDEKDKDNSPENQVPELYGKIKKLLKIVYALGESALSQTNATKKEIVSDVLKKIPDIFSLLSLIEDSGLCGDGGSESDSDGSESDSDG